MSDTEPDLADVQATQADIDCVNEFWRLSVNWGSMEDMRLLVARHRIAAIEECAKALEADAKMCDCAALEERECACGSWDDYKSITSARAVEIVRALKGKDQ